MNKRFLHLWGMPILLGVLTSIGLVSALLGDGIWDIVSAFALGVPVAVGGWHSLRKGDPRTR
ncbi:hypothetical protein [Massilia sp. Leaf139]|uniref:hypothetical protein n=1 Tax=Massilia sp. Leaf139 TaxID=1736272 RepID=UPI0006FA9918|nr:hypothetical protein [Massilia sp. Leaf139]KQQ97124.1 hypothetical protein ASF77_03955 [Massilia sp. Leaf139]